MSHVFLAIPGRMQDACVSGMFEPTQRHRIQIVPNPEGNLCDCFNTLWCVMCGQDECLDWWAMLHTDILPSRFWIDTLIEEAERTGADVMAAHVRIGNQRGLTSTGIRYGSDCVRRLSMREIFNLPETFSIKDTDAADQDIGYPTQGCWVARVGPWIDGFPGFHTTNRIVAKHGIRVPESDSEDWRFSEWAHHEGLKVYATRKVVTDHEKRMRFSTAAPEGEWLTDQKFVKPLAVPYPSPNITIETAKPVAVDSLDHTNPLGTMQDNSTNPAFVGKLGKLITDRQVRVLDLGCAGGAFVRSVLDEGGFGIGIEGSGLLGSSISGRNGRQSLSISSRQTLQSRSAC